MMVLISSQMRTTQEIHNETVVDTTDNRMHCVSWSRINKTTTKARDRESKGVRLDK